MCCHIVQSQQQISVLYRKPLYSLKRDKCLTIQDSCWILPSKKYGLAMFFSVPALTPETYGLKFFFSSYDLYAENVNGKVINWFS
jgi:hypothetical protein